jgi:lysophospholipase
MSKTILSDADVNNELALAPSNGHAFTIITEDRKKLRIAIWAREDAKKGSIFILPGRADFIEKLGHSISELHEAGYTVCVIEFRGLGLSDRLTKDRRAGYVKHFSDYQHDMRALMSAALELNLPKPWNMLGNSMGGTIGLRAVIEGLPFDACAYTSPMWGIKLSPLEHFIAPPITGAVRALGFGHLYAPGKNGSSEILETSFEQNEVTSDPDMFAYLQHVTKNTDEHWIGGPTIGWLQQALHETKALSSQASPSIRSISFSAGNDRLVDVKIIKSRMQNWEGGQFVHVPEARHDLLRESGKIRGSVLGSIMTFFDGCLL